MAKSAPDLVAQLHAEEKTAWEQYSRLLFRLLKESPAPADAQRLSELSQRLFLPAALVATHLEVLREARRLMETAERLAERDRNPEPHDSAAAAAHAEMLKRTRELAGIRKFITAEDVEEREAQIAASRGKYHEHHAAAEAARSARNAWNTASENLHGLCARYPQVFGNLEFPMLPAV